MIYLASDYALPTLAWDRTKPNFHVSELTASDEPVRGQFSKPFVYYAGSHEGCGCGFQWGEYDVTNEEDLPVKRESRRRLAAYLSVALQHQPVVEVYACWAGDEAEPTEHTGRVKPSELVQSRTFFRERELLVVSERNENEPILANSP